MNLVPKIAKKPAWMRVLYVLWEAKRTDRKYGTLPVGWLPVNIIRDETGSSAADARLREMRLDADPNESIKKQIVHRSAPVSKAKKFPGYQFAYTLNCPCSDIDWPEIFAQGNNWKYKKPVNRQLELINFGEEKDDK
jgi:hypothetical protein